MKTIHLVRHAQTEQNKNKIWQGHSSSELNKVGIEQSKLLFKRLKSKNNIVISSDLPRAIETANYISKSVQTRKELREINVGDFSGKSVETTYTKNKNIFNFLTDDSYTFPNGESVKDFKNRVNDEIEYLFQQTKENTEIFVVTHGFFIGTVIGLVMGLNNYPFPIGDIQNTSITSIIKRDSIVQINKFNDALHLSSFDEDNPAKNYKSAITFLRHGQTDSNVLGVWQGKIDNSLNKNGINGAKLLSNKFTNYDLYISSPSKRAIETLELTINRSSNITSENLSEINLGLWEGMKTSEILDTYKNDFVDALFINANSKYGLIGESILEAGLRVKKLISKYKDKNLFLVSHGGTIKGAITVLLDVPIAKAASAFTISNNLGVSTLVPTDNKYYLWSYNVGNLGYENINYNK